MKYSLRSLMIVVLVLPPILAWAGMPLYRWLTTPKAPTVVTSGAIDDTFSDLPTSQAPAPSPPKP
jgi:hypothetical protein